jgi:hypothetical protein
MVSMIAFIISATITSNILAGHFCTFILFMAKTDASDTSKLTKYCKDLMYETYSTLRLGFWSLLFKYWLIFWRVFFSPSGQDLRSKTSGICHLKCSIHNINKSKQHRWLSLNHRLFTGNNSHFQDSLHSCIRSALACHQAGEFILLRTTEELILELLFWLGFTSGRHSKTVNCAKDELVNRFNGTWYVKFGSLSFRQNVSAVPAWQHRYKHEWHKITEALVKELVKMKCAELRPKFGIQCSMLNVAGKIWCRKNDK